jgi:hypothetical protein
MIAVPIKAIGVYFASIQADITQLQLSHRLGDQQDLDEQFLQLARFCRRKWAIVSWSGCMSPAMNRKGITS